VVAGGDRIHAAGKHVLKRFARDAETVRHVFSIHDHDVGMQLIAYARHDRGQRFAANFAHNVAEE